MSLIWKRLMMDSGPLSNRMVSHGAKGGFTHPVMSEGKRHFDPSSSRVYVSPAGVVLNTKHDVGRGVSRIYRRSQSGYSDDRLLGLYSNGFQTRNVIYLKPLDCSFFFLLYFSCFLI
jgi:hypothetical protein